ncbi:MAG: (Fe-S)-binding protein [Desulfobacterales bacterium]|nr:(Fe-S)-binding protein [Desulfobacterales bacterium]
MVDIKDVLEQEFKKNESPVNTAEIRKILDVNSGARIRTWLSICSRCGLCAESCFVYLANNRDPRLSPAYKFKHSLGEMYRRKGKLTREFLKKCYEISWLQCTMCKRCSIFCPFGIDIATMIAISRDICHSQGFRPQSLADFSENCRKSGNHMGIPVEELIDTCEWMAEEAEDEFRGVEIPVDKPNTKYMYTINPREPVYYPQDISNAAIIFTAATESWTIPSFGWDCTNLPMFAGDKALAGQQVKNVYEKAQELGAARILITECGHAYRSMAFEGPYLAGYPSGYPPVEIVHFVRLLYEYLRDGRIKIDPNKKIKEPVTYQDPCNVSRNGGLWEEARKIIPYIAEDFRDMAPNRDHNHCCGGGGGIMPMGPEYKPARMATGRVKAEQIKATGAQIVIAPCHNCFDQINDLSEEYELGVKALSLKEIVVESMIIPDHMQLAEDG